VWHDRVPDEPRWRFDIELPTAHITGRVVDREGNGRRDVSAERGAAQSQARRFTQVTFGTTRTASDGGFSFEHLTAGVYTLSVGSPGPPRAAASAAERGGPRAPRH